MDVSSVVAILRALNDAGARYLVVGGLAVVAHGYVRFTADLDLVLDMEEDNLERATAALSTLGYSPRAPVRLEEFCRKEKRKRWEHEKGLTVFSLWSSRHPFTEIDLFIDSPFEDFQVALDRAARKEVVHGVEAVVVGLDDLLDLKRRAGRQRDMDDILKLEGLRNRLP